MEKTRGLVEATGRRAITVATDISDQQQCQGLVDATMAEFGRLDILVNNAGIGMATPALRETPDDFRKVLDVNVCGTFWMSQAAARVMQPGSSIVNVSSIMAWLSVGMPQASYMASKAGLMGLTRELAAGL